MEPNDCRVQDGPTEPKMSYPERVPVISVDVGTTSVRLAIIVFYGEDLKHAKVLASQEKDIDHFQNGSRFEQQSRQIFEAICECSKVCIQRADIDPELIASIGFSATCSLVIHKEHDQSNDVIMWMDHRAVKEAQSITSNGSKVLQQFGGTCSPEFSLSKLIWLRDNAKDRLDAASGLFELPDWLVYRCLGGDAKQSPRSLCSLVCKWGYNADLNCHCDIVESSFSEATKEKFGTTVMRPGMVAGFMSVEAAVQMGLFVSHSGCSSRTRTDIVVGTSLIDAHAGMLAMLSVPTSHYGADLAIETKFCSLAGTSSCHMLLSKENKFTKGVWGPYRNVVLDNFYLLEAGQTLTGKLVELCIQQSIEGKMLLESGSSMKQIIQNLNHQIAKMDPKSSLTVLPSYHGNRSPLANPRLRGGIYGLSAQNPNLLDSYIAHIEAIAFETRLIVDNLGIELACILVSGGLMKNEFYMQTLANVLKCRVFKIALDDVDVMVMGGALVARCAAINFMTSKARATDTKIDQKPLSEQDVQDLVYDQLHVVAYEPSTVLDKYLERKYLCYKEFVAFSQQVDKIVHEEGIQISQS